MIPASDTLSDMNEESVIAEIDAGESSSQEFKSTLRWNIHAKRNDEEITLAVLRALAGFLNASGGVVLIGVADDGSIVGTALDKYRNDDQFVVVLFNFVKAAFGEDVASLIDAQILTIKGGTICRVHCAASPKPVFLTFAAERDAFLIRTGPVTTKLPASKIHLYIDEHWRKENAGGRPRVTLQYVPPTDEEFGALLFQNVGEAAAFNVGADITVDETKLLLRFGPIPQLDTQTPVEDAPETFYDGTQFGKGKNKGDFRNLMKWIYVQKAGEEMRKSGATDDAIREFVRRPHVTKFNVTYTDFAGHAYASTHTLTYDSSKHSVVIQLAHEAG